MLPNELAFAEVWAEDFEFSAPPGEKPTPVCYVAKELISGRRIRLPHYGVRPRGDNSTTSG
jgi:hypothetical protein